MRVATGTWTKWNPMANMTTKFLRVLYCQEPELQVSDCLRLENNSWAANHHLKKELS